MDDEQIAEALRARLGPDQPVRVGPVPELRAPLAALSRFMGRGRGSRREEPLWTDEASAEALTGFFDAAAQFERSAPWEVAGDGQVLGLDVPALGWEGACASILGAAGEEFGLLLLRSLEDYVAFMRLAGEPSGPRSGDGASASRSSASTSTTRTTSRGATSSRSGPARTAGSRAPTGGSPTSSR